MLRKFALMLMIIFVGTVGMASVAAAAPGYASPGSAVTYLGDDNYQVDVTAFGDSDNADDYAELTVSYGTPSGLRYSSALATAAKSEVYRIDLDDDGSGSIVVTVTQPGQVYFSVVGFPSGDSTAVTIPHKISGTTSPATVTAADGHTSTTGTSGYGASSGLAATGTSIAGPIAIGAGVLLVGLALLFFGTRGVIRRKAVKTGHGN